MRLGQLARKLDQKPQEIISFLLEEHQIEIDNNLNSKVEDEALELVMTHFKKEELADEAVEVINPEVEVQVEEEVEEELVIDEEKIETEALETVAEEVFESESEEPASDQAETSVSVEAEIDADEITEADIAERMKDGVIKAPKKELEGPKVVGKIELPTVKRKVIFIVTNSGQSKDVTEAIFEKRKSEKEARRKKAYEARQNRKKRSKPKRQRKVLSEAEKKAHQAKIDAKKTAEAGKKLKEKKKAHYLKQVQEHQPVQSQKQKKKEIQKAQKRAEERNKKPEPTTRWGKFIKWLNT